MQALNPPPDANDVLGHHVFEIRA